MFKKMLAAVGVGGPSVDAQLHNERCQPGGTVTGQIRIGGAEEETRIQKIDMFLVAEVELEAADDQRLPLEFGRVTVAKEFEIDDEEYLTIPFTLQIPWQTPINMIDGQPVRGMKLGLRTEAAVEKAIDTSDMDPIWIEPLPGQKAVLDGLGKLGAQLRKGDLEQGRIRKTPQHLPFFQELEYTAPREVAGRIQEVEVTFIADQNEMHVILEADKRSGAFTRGGDAQGRIRRSHAEATQADWAAEIDNWLKSIL